MVNEIFKKNDFTQPFFNASEIFTINHFKALKKQIEWICGRVLVKQMIQHLFLSDTPFNEITLSYLAEGAPILSARPDIPVSLSHSNDYTAAVCSSRQDQCLGIDIEMIGKRPDAYFLKTAFTQTEIQHLPNTAAAVFRNWTIKEAYLKYIKKGFNESLHRVEVIGNEIFHNQQKIHVNIFSKHIDNDYILSLVSD
jgi:4'-phosphopantetheinyl transferase